jgi:hypothetical protein
MISQGMSYTYSLDVGNVGNAGMVTSGGGGTATAGTGGGGDASVTAETAGTKKPSVKRNSNKFNSPRRQQKDLTFRGFSGHAARETSMHVTTRFFARKNGERQSTAELHVTHSWKLLLKLEPTLQK